MKNKFRHIAKGQSLVEFALVLPILLLVIFGLFDLGYAVFIKNMISNAAREGARTGIIISKTDADIRARVNAAAPGLNLTPTQVAITPPNKRKFDEPITVTVTYTYAPFTPVIGGITGSVPISSTSVMLVEGVIVP
jgi:Flp pilus assembly protein TadG